MEGIDPRIVQALRLLDTAHDMERVANRTNSLNRDYYLDRAAALRNQSRALVIQARGVW